MESINEIMNRDHRTTVSVIRKLRKRSNISQAHKVHFNILNQCDKSQNVRQIKLFAKNYKSTPTTKLFSYYLILALSVYIMSSKQAEAYPSRSRRDGNDETDNAAAIKSPIEAKDQINFLNPNCAVERIEGHHTLTLTGLKARLKAILDSSRQTLYDTKNYTDAYIQETWKTKSVMGHHDTWKDHHITWLNPNKKKLPYKFRDEAHNKKEGKKFNEIEWTQPLIIEYLTELYARFQRIGVGLQIVNKWHEIVLKGSNLSVAQKEVEISQKLFGSATVGTHNVLCEIQDLFYDMSIDPRNDLDIRPFVLDHMVKLNHWLVYREYENLMDYSHALLYAISTPHHQHHSKN